MFTGIIQAVGRVAELETGEAGGVLEVAGGLTASDLEIGESICTSGVCLTVRAITASGFVADLSAETLARTTLGGLVPGALLNLERSLRVGDRMGGHFVFGHVDGVGEVLGLEPVGDGWSLRVGCPDGIVPYLVDKGSIAVDGISLTMCDCADGSFGVALIPHTMAATNLAGCRVGARVNLEVDMLARYARRAVEALTSAGRD